MQVSIRDIHIKDRLRMLDIEHARELAESIRELGLLNPLTVDRDYTLIAGLHRLEADAKISKKSAMKLARLEPEQQKEAASLLAAREIRSVNEYMPKTGEEGNWKKYQEVGNGHVWRKQSHQKGFQQMLQTAIHRTAIYKGRILLLVAGRW